MERQTRNQVTELEAWRSFAFYLENCICTAEEMPYTFEEFCQSENYEVLPVFSPRQVFGLFVATALGLLFWCTTAFGLGFWWGYSK